MRRLGIIVPILLFTHPQFVVEFDHMLNYFSVGVAGSDSFNGTTHHNFSDLAVIIQLSLRGLPNNTHPVEFAPVAVIECARIDKQHVSLFQDIIRWPQHSGAVSLGFSFSFGYHQNL